MLFNEVIERMNLFTLSATRTSDLAICAKKMMNWDKDAWSETPYLTTASNRPNLDEKLLPLIHMLSVESRITASLIFKEPKPSDLDENGGFCFGSEDDFIPIEHMIGSQIILYNYCLLEAYEFYLFKTLLRSKSDMFLNEKFSLKDIINRGSDKLLDGILIREQNNYERMGVRKRINHWSKFDINPLPENWISAYEEMSNTRNILTHEAFPEDVDLRDSIIYFHRTRLIARKLAIHFNDKSVSLCTSPLDDYPDI